MAATPNDVTHAFVLNDSTLAYGMLHSTTDPKFIENRQVAFRAGWYGVSLSQTAHTSVGHEFEYRDREKDFPSPVAFTRGQILGVVRIGYSLPQAMCSKNRWAAAQYAVGNIITEVIPFSLYDPGPHIRGNFGTFPISPEARSALSVHVAKYRSDLRRTHAEEQLPPSPGKLEESRNQAKKTLGKGKEKASNGKQVSKVAAPKPPRSAISKRSKKEVTSQSDKELKAAMKEMDDCARLMPKTHGHEVVKKGILAFFEKTVNTPK